MNCSSLEKVLARIREIEDRFGARNVISSPSRPPATSEALPRESFEELIEHYAKKYDMDPKLVKKLVQVESNFNPHAVSPKGAMGLMQLMPETCRDLGVKNPFDVRENLEGGLRYLKGLMERFQDVRLALAAYNAGPGRVKEYGGIPPFPETQRFVRKVLEG